MILDNNQDSLAFWSSLFLSLADNSDPNDLYPESRSPIMVMSTSMSIDVPAELWKVPEDVHKKAGPKNAAAEAGVKNINEVGEKSTGKAMEKGKEEEEPAREGTKSLGKRPRGSESRKINDKRRRAEINNKIEKLKELTRCTGKRNKVSTLDSIANSIGDMKLYVDTYHSYCMGYMMPLGMGMDCPTPWMYPPYVPPHFMMPYNRFAPAQTSGYGNQVVPVSTKGVNNQP